MLKTNAEQERLNEADARRQPWRKWGPYVSERQWGMVREDYSADGDAWNYFPHEHAHSRAYRWGEDGIRRTANSWGRRPLLLLGLASRRYARCFSRSPRTRHASSSSRRWTASA